MTHTGTGLLVVAAHLAWLPLAHDLPWAVNAFMFIAALLRSARSLFGWQPAPAGITVVTVAVTAMAALPSINATSLTDGGKSVAALLLAALLCAGRTPRSIQRTLCLCVGLTAFQLPEAQSVVSAMPAALTILITLLLLTGAQARDSTAPQREDDAAKGTRIALTLYLAAIPVAAVLFLVFPRLPTGLFGERALSSTGMSDTMRPGSIGELAESNEPAFTATFDGQVPSSETLYWRANVLDQYDGSVWSTGATPDIQGRATASVTTSWTNSRSARGTDYTIRLEPHGNRWIFLLEGTTEITLVGTGTGTEGLSSALDGTVAVSGGVHQVLSLRAEASRPPRLPATAASLERALRLPEGFNPRTVAFAKSILNDARDKTPLALSRQLLSHIHREPFYYSLRAPRLGMHAADDFLFGTRKGFCEHYAGAYVIVMRAMGVPARVVTGYQGGDVMTGSNVVEVLQRNAHAWAEIYAGPDTGWVRVDPTSAVASHRVERGTRARGTTGNLLSLLGLEVPTALAGATRTISRVMTKVDLGWKRAVLQFNESSQNRLLGSLVGADASKSPWLPVITLMVIAVGAIMIVALTMAHQRGDPMARLLSAIVRATGRYGLRREPSETLAAFVTRTSTVLPAAHVRILEQAVLAYSDMRYAGGAMDRRLVQEHAQQLRTVRPSKRSVVKHFVFHRFLQRKS